MKINQLKEIYKIIMKNKLHLFLLLISIIIFFTGTIIYIIGLYLVWVLDISTGIMANLAGAVIIIFNYIILLYYDTIE